MTVESDFEALLAKREGQSLTVYLDSRGIPTVGIGHRVVPTDRLAVGDAITEAECHQLFAVDSAWAMAAARQQASQAGIADEAFLPYLASVCFQLGPNWTAEFPNTWAMICRREYEAAAQALGSSAWARQTPVRVADFQGALRRLGSQS